jgi:ABC-type transport system involved in cytochrome bd biosynthesis fused ATPase/permease subunit
LEWDLGQTVILRRLIRAAGNISRLQMGLLEFESLKEILLFDEPTSGLDYKNMCLCADFLKQNQELIKNKTVIMISQNWTM